MEKSNKVGMIFFYIAFIICFLITAFAATTYTVSFIKDKINDKESVYVEYEEHEVFSTYGELGLCKKYNYSVIIKVDHDEYIVFKTDIFIVKGDTVIIKLEEYPNGDTYASIVGVNCKRILIEEGTVIDSVAGKGGN